MDEKTVGPAQHLSFLGLEIDTLTQTVCVPHDKVLATSALIGQALSKKKISLQSIQSLVGLLNFLCKAIPPGRTFLRRLIRLHSGLRRPHHKVHISTGAWLDLVTWLDFLSNFNGISVFPASEWESNDTVSLFTNASASIGYGTYGCKAIGRPTCCAYALP